MRVLIRSVLKMGTSIGITLPYKFAKLHKITENSRIAIFVFEDRLEVRTIDEKQLHQLVKDNAELLNAGAINEDVLLERAEKLKLIKQQKGDEK